MTKKKLNKIADHPLQTWQWGEFRKAAGNEVVRETFGQILFHRLPFLPYKIGSFIKGLKPTARMLARLKALGKEKKAIFIKIEPNYAVKSKNELNQLVHLFRANGAVSGKTLFTPTSFVIDLTIDEESLLASFHPKARYNIRLAERKGVKIAEDNSDQAFKKYLELMRKTVERQGFFAHTEKYHRLMWRHLHKDLVAKGQTPIARLLTAKVRGKIVTAWIVFVWKDCLYYPYGASTDEYKNFQANSLMMWEAIKYGQRLGLKNFDLWGREEGKGFTKFKEGYSPRVVEFSGSWDLITHPLYYLYKVFEPIRWTLLRTKSKLVKPNF